MAPPDSFCSMTLQPVFPNIISFLLDVSKWCPKMVLALVHVGARCSKMRRRTTVRWPGTTWQFFSLAAVPRGPPRSSGGPGRSLAVSPVPREGPGRFLGGSPAVPRRPRGGPEGPPASSRRQSTNQADWTFGLLVDFWNLVCLARPQPTTQPGWTFGRLVGSTNQLVFSSPTNHPTNEIGPLASWLVLGIG
jgi:hypothetical protein